MYPSFIIWPWVFSFGQGGLAVLRFDVRPLWHELFKSGNIELLRIARGILVLISPAVYLRKDKTSLSHVIRIRPIFCVFCTNMWLWHLVNVTVVFLLFSLFVCLFVLFCTFSLPTVNRVGYISTTSNYYRFLLVAGPIMDYYILSFVCLSFCECLKSKNELENTHSRSHWPL